MKEAVGLFQKIDNIDLYRKILDLQAEVIALVQENTELKQRVAKRVTMWLHRPLRRHRYVAGRVLDGSGTKRCGRHTKASR